MELEFECDFLGLVKALQVPRRFHTCVYVHLYISMHVCMHVFKDL